MVRIGFIVLHRYKLVPGKHSCVACYYTCRGVCVPALINTFRFRIGQSGWDRVRLECIVSTTQWATSVASSWSATGSLTILIRVGSLEQ